MGEIDFGEDLTILILADPTPTSRWLSFTTWASCRKFLPDSRQVLAIRRPIPGEASIDFPWAHRLGVANFSCRKLEDAESIARSRGLLSGRLRSLDSGCAIISPLRAGWEGSIAGDCSSTDDFDIVSIGDGIGPLKVSSWINRLGHPMHLSGTLGRCPLTRNERKILEVWDDYVRIYDSVN